MPDKKASTEFVQTIPIKSIKNNPQQSRIFMDKERLDDLSKSIKEHGVLQPILVKNEGDDIILVAGQRRLEAAKKAGLEKIPAHFIDSDPLEIGIIENLQREDLHPIDASESLFKFREKRIDERGECKQEELAIISGKAQNTISEILALMKLPDSIRKECRKESRWTRTMLLKIARKKTEEKMKAAYEKAKRKMQEEEQEKSQSPKQNKTEKSASVFLKRIDLFHKSFEKMDLGKVRAKKKEEMKTKLASLKEFIEEKLREIG